MSLLKTTIGIMATNVVSVVNFFRQGDDMQGYSVKQIQYSDTKDLILNVHYAKRMPSISYA